jgi:ferredoxin--NADP+ reductase
MTRPLRVAVVGAGPAGVYTADALTFEAPVLVDLLERLPVPFGLLRHGVAPDHLSVKSAEQVLHAVLERPGVRLLANVEVGRDVTLDELRQAYDVVVHAGARRGCATWACPGRTCPAACPRRRSSAGTTARPTPPPARRPGRAWPSSAPAT